MLSKFSFRRIVLFALVVSLAWAITACNRKDDGVSPAVQVPPVANQVQQIPKQVLAILQNATEPVDFTAPQSVLSPTEVITQLSAAGSEPLPLGKIMPSIKASLAPNPSGPNLALSAVAGASTYWPWPLNYGPGGSAIWLYPWRANNGDPGDFWASSYGAYNHVFYLTWAQPVTISRIWILNQFWNWVGQTIQQIRYFNPATQAYVTIPGTTGSYGGNGNPNNINFTFPPVQTTGIAVLMNTGPVNPHPNSSVTIDEIEVYGEATGSLKIASPTNGELFAYGETVSFIASKTGSITNIEWLDNGVAFAVGLSASKSDLSPGTHTITLRGTKGGVVASVKQATGSFRAQVSGDTVSDSISVTVIKSIKIKDMDTGQEPVLPFKMSSIRGIKKFQTIGCFDDFGNNEYGSVKVDWSLLDGEISSEDTMKKEILNILDSNRGKIGVLVTQNATDTKILNSDFATFISYFSGNITLKVEFHRGEAHQIASKSIIINLTKPTFSVTVWPVSDVGPLDIFGDWKNTTIQVWQKDNILKINSISLGSEISNVTYPGFPMTSPYRGAEVKLKDKQDVSYWNPIMMDCILKRDSGLNLLPRQPHLLFSNRISGDINAFIVKQPYTTQPSIKGVYPAFYPDIDNPEFNEMSGVAINTGEYYDFDSHAILSDRNRSGIAIKNVMSPFTLSHKRVLAHEIGHILIQNGDEHFLDGVQTPLPADNLMNGGNSTGLGLLPSQYISIFNLDGKKTTRTSLIVEE